MKATEITHRIQPRNAPAKAAAFIGLLVGLWPMVALPCGGPPPSSVACPVQVTCVLGSPEIQFQTEAGIGGSGGTTVNVPTRLHRSIRALLPGQSCLPGTGIVSTDVTIVADCEEMLVDGSALDPIFIGAATLPGGTLGTTVLDVPINIDIPGPEREDRGYCALSGTAHVEQQDGIEHEVPCGPAFLSFARPTLTGTAPILGGQLIDNGDFTQVGTGHYSTMAGAPTLLEMVLNNNHPTEAFEGTLELVTNNENYGAEMVSGPIMTQADSLSYSLSSGPGDDFVVHFVPESEGTEEEIAAVLAAAMCFDLPAPQLSISPLASRTVSIPAGESITVAMWSRTWPNCADGSCSGMAFDLEGAFSGGELYEAKLSGSLIVQAVSILQQQISCKGQGVTALVTKCEDDDDGCAAEEEVRDERDARPVGLIFESDLHTPRPAITSTDTEISVATTGRTIEEQLTGEDSGRLWETLTLPRGVLTPGQEVTVTSTFSLTLVGNTEGYSVTEVVVGSKYQPASEEKGVDPTSFIGVARVEVSTTPYMELTIQYQGGAWAVEVDEEGVVGLELTAYDLRTSDGGIIAEFTFLAPEWEIDRVQISHDLRAYGWDAFEDDCEDLSDNDNDGDVDCDDEDCDGHPACDGDDDDSAGDDDDSGADDDDDVGPGDDDDDDDSTGEDEGCGCNAASGTLPATLLALLLPALVMRRRLRTLR
jgi:hypothetical protein